jgi:hypothetical protein
VWCAVRLPDRVADRAEEARKEAGRDVRRAKRRQGLEKERSCTAMAASAPESGAAAAM